MAEIYSVLITGANRGIGLEFVKQFLTNPLVKTHIVIAACRSPDEATVLQELKRRRANLYIVKLNVDDFDTYDSVLNEVQNITGDKGLTLLINNAGIVRGMNKLDSISAEKFISVLTTNTVAPVMLTKTLRPLLKLSAEVNAAKHNTDLCVTKAAVVNISSRIGSIKLNNSPEFHRVYGYRESKAALNMATQTLSLELGKDGILVESFHPGHVDTDMTKGTEAPLDTLTSVIGMLKVMLNLKEKNKNGFQSWDGEVLPF